MVGSLWNLRDFDTPLVVEEFYRRMGLGQPGGEKGCDYAAFALNETVNHLRTKEFKEKPSRWIPLVHYGI